MSTTLGGLETQLFAYVQLRGLKSVRTGELIGPLGITPVQERELLSRLMRRGLIARVRRGLYLVPPRIPPDDCSPFRLAADCLRCWFVRLVCARGAGRSRNRPVPGYRQLHV